METYVITEPCVGVKDGACVEVCPVACIHTTPDSPQYYIDPDICIACEQCEIVCPVKAIFLDRDVPEQWSEYTEVNASFFKANKPAIEAVTLAHSSRLAEVAQEFAAARGGSVAVAVVDPEGEVVHQVSMVGAAPETLEAAVERARKAVKTGKRDIGSQPLLADPMTVVIGGLGVAGGGEIDSGAAIAAWETVH